MPLEGVKVGPLDPDSTSAFGHVGRGQTARQLIRLHTQLHPPALRRHLARPLDEPHTNGLDLEEVREHLAGLKRENGDPMVPRGAEVVGATVRGEKSTGRVLTFTYRMPSGRTGKWFTSYSAEVLPGSFEQGVELTRVRDMKDQGVVSFDTEGARVEILERQLRDARREAAALRRHVEGGDEGDAPEAPEGEGSAAPDLRNDEGVREELEQARREAQELRARVAQYEALQGTQVAGGRVATEGADELLGSGTLGEDEPVPGYDELTAARAAELLKNPDTDRETVERVLQYERSHQDRSTVTKAGESALDRS